MVYPHPSFSLQRQEFWHSAFFMVQLSHPYMTTGKAKALSRWTFVGKLTSLLFNTLLGFAIAFPPSSRCLLFSWLKSLPAVILEPRKMKSVIVSIVSPSIFHEVMRPDAKLRWWVSSIKELCIGHPKRIRVRLKT